MELFYYKSKSGNFGDDLNLWLWDEILPGWREAFPDHLLIGVGTLINHKLTRNIPKLVLGAGVGYGDLPDQGLLSECRFLAVRGPESEKILGLPRGAGVVDPAVLVADLDEFSNITKSRRPVFVPHHASLHRMDWSRLCERAGVDFVSPEGDAKEVIRKLAAAPLVIAESMHAAIIADAFGTPWHAISISHRFHAAKWQDWAKSLGIDLRVRPLYPLLDRLASIFPKRVQSAGVVKDGEGGSVARQKVPSPGGKPAFRIRIRLLIERWLTVRRLKKLSREAGQLSDRVRLSEAKNRYRQVLAQALLQ